MPIDILERYKLAIERHHWHSELRVKMVGGWFAIFAALAVSLAWLHKHAPDLAWLSPLAGMFAAVGMFLADVRHRIGLYDAMNAGKAIEASAEAGIPPDQWLFKASGLPPGEKPSRLYEFLKNGSSHRALIFWFAVLAFFVCLTATITLFWRVGGWP